LRIGITIGDPAGIGPEVVVKALAAADAPVADYVVYGPARIIETACNRFGVHLPASTSIAAVPGDPVSPGRPSAAGGRVAGEAVVAAARDAMAGRLDALATAPLNKESLKAAGYPWPGHTELLAEVSGTTDYAMMFVGGGLRVALLTIHTALRAVPDVVSAAEIERLARLLHRELPRFGAAHRRIALCGLNPHAGEGGMFGTEELEHHIPAVKRLRAVGLDVSGPFPADTVFGRAAAGEFDAVIANYHDQGLIPVKLAAFGESVNVTIGLPFIRTSVDHGTGFDIVDKGIANPRSMLAAIRLAVDLAARRAATG
jgi:4-hydroxythreonine-4-phosphate dehydrogenase